MKDSSDQLMSSIDDAILDNMYLMAFILDKNKKKKVKFNHAISLSGINQQQLKTFNSFTFFSCITFIMFWYPIVTSSYKV